MIFFIKTFGCQMNEADSQRLGTALVSQGHQLAGNVHQADVVVINTCCVRESAENRVFGFINNLKIRKSKHLKIILTGCMVGSARGQRRRYTLKQLKQKLPQVDEFKTIEELLGKNSQLITRHSKTAALVPIMRGCDNFCTYCVVPYARGKEVSRPFDEIVCEVKELTKRGYKEVTLLGQNVNAYFGAGVGFAKLLRRLHQIRGLQKISFLTSNPWDLTDEIIQTLSLPKIDRQLHLPVQSGDDEILAKMNRPYTATDYLKLVKKIKQKIPAIKITTDIIVGFPGETKKAFQNTVELCKKVGFQKAYIARYSPRPGTAAFRLKDDVPAAEKKRRWRILEKLINE